MFGESFLLSGMHRRVITPRPAAKLGLLIISKCLLEFLARVHNKRSVVRDRLSDRAAFEKEIEQLDPLSDGSSGGSSFRE